MNMAVHSLLQAFSFLSVELERKIAELLNVSVQKNELQSLKAADFMPLPFNVLVLTLTSLMSVIYLTPSCVIVPSCSSHRDPWSRNKMSHGWPTAACAKPAHTWPHIDIAVSNANLLLPLSSPE